MSSFTVRVELNSATVQDYVRLHGCMENAGFSRTIRADDGRLFHLPPAEYALEGSAFALSDVHHLVEHVIARAECRGEFLITEALGRSWSLKSAASPELTNALAALLAQAPRTQTSPPNAFAGLGGLFGAGPRSILDGLG